MNLLPNAGNFTKFPDLGGPETANNGVITGLQMQFP
jgi:hypothetical protein